MRLLAIALAASLLALGGCASNPDARIDRELDEQNALDAYNRAVAPEERLVCERRVKTGSHIRTKVCLTAAQLEAERDRARALVEAARSAAGRVPSRNGGGSGGLSSPRP